MSQTIASSYNTIAKLSGAVGMLIDRSISGTQHVGTVWMVDETTAATCAHLVALYTDFLEALIVRFPHNDKTFSVSAVTVHPRFDREVALEMAQRSLSSSVPALALQDYNLALLKLSPDVTALDPTHATAFNKRIAASPGPRDKSLSGHVEEIGLALVMQTVSNARKDGVLYICDERNRPLARLFFRAGKVLYAKFGKTANEFAIYQMFQDNLTGQFHFKQQEAPDWNVNAPMGRPLEGILLEAHRRLDEAPNLAEQLGGRTTAYEKATELMCKDGLPNEMVPYAERIWPLLDGGIAVDQLWDVVSLDSYTAYATLVELLDKKLIKEVPQVITKGTAAATLEMAAYEPLSPWDEIISLTPHPVNGRAQMRRGSLVGLLRPNDPYHLLHSLNLPYRCAGSPIFKNGKLIGMHCGMLPLDPALHALPHHLHQLLWVDAVQVCLNAKQKKSWSQKKSVGMARPVESPDGKKICNKCQSPMVKQALFCGTCGSKM
ncbi:MAG TPA: DUF4388 domain-containing protein [Candidatus Obscuribacterales bacterium]